MTEWGGEERRVQNIEAVAAVRDDLAAVKNALLEVAGGLTQVVPRPEVERMMATERRGRYRTTIYLLGLMATMFAFAGFGVAQLASIEKLTQQTKTIAEQDERLTQQTKTIAEQNVRLNEANLSIARKLECAIHAASLQGVDQRDAFIRCDEIDGSVHD